MAGSKLPLATAVVSILLATSAVPVAVAAADKYSGRMVIIRAPGARVVVDVSAGGAALNKQWQQRRRRRRLVEDEVAPEYGGLGHGQLGAGNGGHISAEAENKDRQVCLPDGACTTPGGPYTRPCAYKDRCPH